MKKNVNEIKGTEC